jgi:hypothetical protein
VETFQSDNDLPIRLVNRSNGPFDDLTVSEPAPFLSRLLRFTPPEPTVVLVALLAALALGYRIERDAATEKVAAILTLAAMLLSTAIAFVWITKRAERDRWQQRRDSISSSGLQPTSGSKRSSS